MFSLGELRDDVIILNFPQEFPLKAFANMEELLSCLS